MSITKSLERAGYLKPLSGGFKSFMEKLNKTADQDEFNRLMGSAIEEIKATYSGQDESTFTSGQPQSRMGDLLPRLGTRQGEFEQGGAIDDPNRPGINILDQPEDEILGDVTGRRFGTITEDEQRMQIQRKIADTLIKGSGLKNLDPSKLTQGTSILDLVGQSVTPRKLTSELKQFDVGKDLYEIDEDGNFSLVRPGKRIGKEKSIGTYTGKDGFHYTKMYDPETGLTYELKSENKVRPQKGLKINYPKSEKWKDFGSIINFIEFKQDPNTKLMVPTTELEKKQNREIAQNQALGTMLPGAVNFVREKIWGDWGGRQNMSLDDFEAEILEGIDDGQLSAEDARDLLDYNQFRPFIYDALIDNVKVIEEGADQ